MTSSSSSADDLAATLADRSAYLRALIEQPRSKSDLEEVLDCSRSTIDRAVGDLADAGLVDYEDGIWRPTLLGLCTVHARDAYLDQLADLADAAPILNALPADSPVNCAFLDGVDVYEADPSMPDAVIQQVVALIDDAPEVALATPALPLSVARSICDQVATETTSMELLVPSTVFEQAHATVPSLTKRMLTEPTISVYHASIPFAFGLFVAESLAAALVVFTDQGIRGLLVNDTDAALEWATTQYERAKQDAETITLRGSARTPN